MVKTVKKSKKRLLREILKIYPYGRYREIKQLLERVMKIGRLTVNEKIEVSSYYWNIGEFTKGLKVLGPELTLQDMEIIKFSDAAPQIDMAFIYQFYSANYCAKRILDNLQVAYKPEKLQANLLATTFWKYYYMRAFILFNMHYYQEAKELSLEAREYYRRYDSTFHVKRCWIVYLESCLRLGEVDFVLEESKNLKRELLDSDGLYLMDFHRVVGTAWFFKGDYIKAREHFLLTRTFISDRMHNSKVVSTIYLAITYKRLNLLDEARETLKWISEKIISYQSRVDTWRFYLLSLKKEFNKVLSLNDNLMLSLFPGYSPYTNYIETGVAAKVFPFATDLTDHNYEKQIWSFKHSKLDRIALKEYGNLIQNKKEFTIDLVSGILLNDGKTQQVLTLIESRALRALLGAGKYGITLWGLADFVYRDKVIIPDLTTDKIKKLVLRLKQLGFVISLEKSLYKIFLPRNVRVLAPMKNRDIDRRALMFAIYGKKFRATDIAHHFRLQRSQAFEWKSEFSKMAS
jgi:hypothetical protein